MIDRFGDAAASGPGGGGFFFTDRAATDLIVRQKTATDSPLPSGNAVAALVLLELGRVEAAGDVVATFARQVEQNGEGMSAMIQAAHAYLAAGPSFIVSTDAASPAADLRPASAEDRARSVVQLTVEWATPTELRLTLRIDPPYHINAAAGADIAADDPLIPTSVKLYAPICTSYRSTTRRRSRVDFPSPTARCRSTRANAIFAFASTAQRWQASRSASP